MGLIEVLGGHPTPWLASASLSLGALSTLPQMAHESTVEHSRLDSGDAVTALPPWLAQHGDPGQQVGGREQRGRRTWASCHADALRVLCPLSPFCTVSGPPGLEWGGGR